MTLHQLWLRVTARLLTTKQRFTRIHRHGGFGGSAETVSGRGSTLESTVHIRSQMPLLMRRHGISNLLDAPCGDFNWMKEIVGKEPMSGISYVGIDVVSDIIKQNAKLYGTNSIRFLEANIISDPLPTADMVLCRDCFIHFSYADIFRTLRNFRQCGIKYILTNSFVNVSTNKDISTGSWRQMNLEIVPFAFPKPIEFIEERDSGTNGKLLTLWSLADLPL